MKQSPSLELPEPWKSLYAERAEAIRLRLDDFSAVPESEHFYELLFCILTPQSSARNAGQVIAKLKDSKFFETGDDPTDLLRNPAHYIRFHNVKAKRLLVIRDNFPAIRSIINTNRENLPQLREELRIAVP